MLRHPPAGPAHHQSPALRQLLGRRPHLGRPSREDLSKDPPSADPRATYRKRVQAKVGTSTGLLPESEFAASFSEPVQVTVQLPIDDTNPEWSLNGSAASVV